MPSRWQRLTPLILLAIPLLYLATLARGLVLGDPTEYTLVAHVLGIAHPPGYAFIIVVGKLFQTLIPFGSIPWRMHLLAATGTTIAAVSLYLAVRALRRGLRVAAPGGGAGAAAGLFAALNIAFAADVWQHAIHANPHILTATFLAANLFLLTRWWASGNDEALPRDDRWLSGAAFLAGLGVTHHPLTVFSAPAYLIFVLSVRPRLWRRPRTILWLAAAVLLGLSLFLYYPIRSPMQPAFGPHNMNTLSGFLDHVLARGLTESLPFFTLVDQPLRALVFWTLLRLQYTLPTIFLAALGFAWLLRRQWRLALLYGLAFLGNYAFVISLRAQDIMAYLLGPFMVVGLLAGVGVLALLHLLGRRAITGMPVALLLVALFLLGPALQVTRNLPAISLRDYDEGDAYVAAVFDTFAGSGEGAVLLNDWEHMTPLWYTRFVEGRWPDPADVRPEFVSTDRPWLVSVFDYLPGGPVYLNSYRREIVDAGFRLRPHGPFYQVLEPGSAETYTVPPGLTPVAATAGEVEIAGYHLPQQATAGDFVPLTLAMTAPLTPTHYYVPAISAGPVVYTHTTDSHLLTTWWQPGEVVVERFDFALPHDMAAGSYPITLHMVDLTAGQRTELALSLGELAVSDQINPPRTAQLLANFRQRAGLVSAWAQQGSQLRRAPWQEPLVVQRGQTLKLLLQWESLALAEESYTVFVHLIDAADRPHVTLDYTPLGGAAPTHLWIPKWLPGQRLLDPYRLPLDAALAPGIYYVEVGLYEMTGQRRLHIAGPDGSLNGDRFILGPVQVE
jgi:hypothetical protein